MSASKSRNADWLGSTRQKCAVIISGLGLVLFLTGCETAQDYSLTYKLWNNPALSQFAEPAPEPRLALFSKPSGHDVLVQYDEANEANEIVCRRAYFLGPNMRRITERKKPRFVDPNVASTLTPIPINQMQTGSTNPPAPETGPAAVYNKASREFSIIGLSDLHGPYSLPVYEESKGNWTRIAFTPLAVTGDTVMVGVVAGIAAAYIYTAGSIDTVRAEEGRGRLFK